METQLDWIKQEVDALLELAITQAIEIRSHIPITDAATDTYRKANVHVELLIRLNRLVAYGAKKDTD